jgi:hypothetical protein
MPTLEERFLLDKLDAEVHALGPTSPHELIPLLRSADQSTRFAATRIVATMDYAPSIIVEIAESLLKDDYELVRLQAIRAICKHSPQQRAITLLKEHQDDSTLVKSLLASYLHRLGPTS